MGAREALGRAREALGRRRGCDIGTRGLHNVRGARLWGDDCGGGYEDMGAVSEGEGLMM